MTSKLTGLFLPQASTFAGDIDHLILLIAIIVGFWLLAAEAVFFYLILRFRAKDGDSRRADYITGEEKHHTRWISIPHALVLLCDVIIIVPAVMVWVNVKQTLPPSTDTVRIISQQWAWSFVDQGPDGKIDTADDIHTADELHVKVDTTYHFDLVSKDVLHSFSVPVFRLKQDAIPGRIITGWFHPTMTGTFDIQCAEICGFGHGLMPARIVVETPAEHAAWLAQRSAPPAPATSPAATPPAAAPVAPAPAVPTPPPPAAETRP